MTMSSFWFFKEVTAQFGLLRRCLQNDKAETWIVNVSTIMSGKADLWTTQKSQDQFWFSGCEYKNKQKRHWKSDKLLQDNG